jgi:4,5-DOPA dioxygenase extradiol
MNRKDFIKAASLIPLSAINMNLSDLNKIESKLAHSNPMPIMFIGHGSPMNAIEENEFVKKWQSIGKKIPKPQMVLCVSAHWETKGTFITAMEKPRTIHDFGGFPKALFDVQYPAPGSPTYAKEVQQNVKSTMVDLDEKWGLDHGTWSIMKHLYPNADVPVLQLSIDYTKPASFHYALAKELASLRHKGVLIIGSGNMVHNLGMVAWDKMNEPEFGFDWAIEMNTTFKKLILDGNHDALIHYENFGLAGRKAIPSPEHYIPLLYTLALKEKNDPVSFFNDKALLGSLTMTSVMIGTE